jgi:hypothetical protein
MPVPLKYLASLSSPYPFILCSLQRMDYRAASSRWRRDTAYDSYGYYLLRHKGSRMQRRASVLFSGASVFPRCLCTRVLSLFLPPLILRSRSLFSLPLALAPLTYFLAHLSLRFQMNFWISSDPIFVKSALSWKVSVIGGFRTSFEAEGREHLQNKSSHCIRRLWTRLDRIARSSE